MQSKSATERIRHIDTWRIQDHHEHQEVEVCEDDQRKKTLLDYERVKFDEEGISDSMLQRSKSEKW